ncbi:hypothetical protein F5Y17DRAFT_429394 [Xylariaceae sp. FL0594]|nr:hypothetical protein F5Y17DRAFT_429394 [Xylariaceae sp. FL0594]
MKSFILALSAFSVAQAGLVLRPRQAADACCFGLESVGIVDEQVNESHVGGLSLGGPFQQGGFCLDKSTKKIQDTLNHGCFMRAPDEQFQCYAGLAGDREFEIEPAGSNGRQYLSYDEGQGNFWACPVGTGANTYYNLFSASKANTAGCSSVALSLYNISPACSATPSNATVSALRVATKPRIRFGNSKPAPKRVPTQPNYDQVPGAALWRRTPSSARKATQSCSVSPTAPSIAPIKLGSTDASSPDGFKDSHGVASITYQNSTIFSYIIPNSFMPETSSGTAPLCALQFRMPACTQLPDGYPCYSFSGLEQEFLSNSGMNWDLIFDDGQAPWNETELQQVTPEEDSILGTFECSRSSLPHGWRQMSWNVSSVRNFGLQFLHAGVGNGSVFQDGIGAWIVPCQ